MHFSAYQTECANWSFLLVRQVLLFLVVSDIPAQDLSHPTKKEGPIGTCSLICTEIHTLIHMYRWKSRNDHYNVNTVTTTTHTRREVQDLCPCWVCCHGKVFLFLKKSSNSFVMVLHLSTRLGLDSLQTEELLKRKAALYKRGQVSTPFWGHLGGEGGCPHCPAFPPTRSMMQCHSLRLFCSLWEHQGAALTSFFDCHWKTEKINWTSITL